MRYPTAPGFGINDVLLGPDLCEAAHQFDRYEDFLRARDELRDVLDAAAEALTYHLGTAEPIRSMMYRANGSPHWVID